MALHLLKLCVGAASIADLESWIEETRLLHHRLGRAYRQYHTTRMIPRRLTALIPEEQRHARPRAGHPRLPSSGEAEKSWMAGTSPAMTAGEITSSSSLYWVIKSRIMARQKLLLIEPFTDEAGISRCHLVLEPVVHPVSPRPCKPFQGWRYLDGKDAPPDLAGGEGAADMPEDVRAELAALGLL